MFVFEVLFENVHRVAFWFFFALTGIVCASSGIAFAVVDIYEFDNDAQRSQYSELVETLRCPKCQNQNIADSNSPIASDMRDAVHRLIVQGKQSDEVVQYMVDRFGEFVVYKPKLDPSTWLLWFGPFLVGLAGFVFVVVMAWKSRDKNRDATTLSASDKSKLSHLLDKEK